MMNSVPMVSVLMTAYNREVYIAAAIESVLASSYKDFELLVIDDCSTDRTVEIAIEYARNDARIRVVRNETNLSQFANRNKAARLAAGKYIKYVDSDDVIYSYTLGHMVEAMERFPSAGLGFCLTHGPCKEPLPYIIEPVAAFTQHFFEGGLLFVGPSGLIIRREVFNEVEGFSEYGMPSDNHFTLKVAGRYPVVAMARDLFWWRQHNGQVFSQNIGNHQNIVNNYSYTTDIIINHSPLPKKINERILFNLKKNLAKHIYKLGVQQMKPLVALRLLLSLGGRY